jgi:hypothetical protein
MALLARIYFNVIFGGTGGLIGWLFYGAFAESGSGLLGGALIGGSIGYFVVSVEALRDRSLLRFCRLASYGLLLGAVGGAVGLALGDALNYALVGQLGARGGVALWGAMLARGLGWMVLGLAIGLSEGIAARSLRKLSYGTLGGALGGLVGGGLFGLVYLQLLQAGPQAAESWAALGGALGLILLGACIGALSALVQGLFQPASIKVLRGWQEGREYPLLRPATLLGRDEHADIALFRDMRVEKRHALIQRRGEQFVLHNHNAPPEQTLVNGQPVAAEQALQDGDRIQLGEIVLRFQRRAALNRARRE